MKNKSAILLFLNVFFYVTTVFAVVVSKENSTAKVIKEAENMALARERLFASNVLIRAIKKADKQSEKELKEKISQLAETYYTDKGFQAFLSGKDLFSKRKLSDALEKLSEADELEKGNTSILHQLTLVLLHLKKKDQADGINKRGLQINPYDLEILKDQVAVRAASEKWAEVIKLTDVLIKEYGEQSAYIYRVRGLADMKLNLMPEARRYLETAQLKDGEFPETYYWLATLKGSPDAEKSLIKYVNMCKNKEKMFFERDSVVCENVAEAEKRAEAL